MDMPKFLLTGLIALVTSVSNAQGFDGRFEDGYALLKAGDPAGALESFQQLLTEDPDSEFVQYSIAAAHYERGLQELETMVTEENMGILYQARDGFDKLRNTEDAFLRKNAPFNAANSVAQVAKHYDVELSYKEKVQAFQDAIVAYETLLRQQPDHHGAMTNLNHSRYKLKKMMQNPPPDQQELNTGDDQEQNQQNQEDQEGEEGEEGQEGQEGEPEETEGEENESDPSEDQDSSGEPQDGAAESQPIEDENIEAILQSLEDINKEEQKNLRKAKGPPQVREGKWW